MLQDHERRSYDSEIAELKAEITGLKEDISDLKKDIKGLVEAWNTAKGMTSFIKWLSGLATAGAVLWALIRGNHG